MKYFIQLLALFSVSFGCMANSQFGAGLGFQFGEQEIDHDWDDELGLHASLIVNQPGRFYAKAASDFSHFHSVTGGYSIPLNTLVGGASFGIGGGFIDYRYSDDNWLFSMMFTANQTYHNMGHGGAIEFNSDSIMINYFVTFIK